MDRRTKDFQKKILCIVHIHTNLMHYLISAYSKRFEAMVAPFNFRYSDVIVINERLKLFSGTTEWREINRLI